MTTRRPRRNIPTISIIPTAGFGAADLTPPPGARPDAGHEASEGDVRLGGSGGASGDRIRGGAKDRTPRRFSKAAGDSTEGHEIKPFSVVPAGGCSAGC